MYKRKELEILYKIIAYLKLDDHTYTHLSTRSSSKESYFILPFGLRFEEITEDNLIEIGLDGKVHSKDDAKYNKTGYVIHGQIYKNREDVNSIIHVHSPEIVAVSSIKEGLMPISQWALHFYNKISYT
jgi:ribulose-5-phosphate 4-epimerase/fuculose-1-phosphate aldolase